MAITRLYVLFLACIAGCANPTEVLSSKPCRFPSFEELCQTNPDYCNHRYNEIAQVRLHNATSTTQKRFGLFEIIDHIDERAFLIDYLHAPDSWWTWSVAHSFWLFKVGLKGLLGTILVGAEVLKAKPDNELIPNPVANQSTSIDQQLADGLRVFKIPIHPVPLNRGPREIYIAHTLQKREFEAYFRQYAGPYLAGSLGEWVNWVFGGSDTQALSLALTQYIEDDILHRVDATNMPLSQFLATVQNFLESHPKEIVTLHFNLFDINDDEMFSVFEKTDLPRYMVPQDADKCWPTLNEMIQTNQRLVVFLDEAGAVNRIVAKYAGRFPWVKGFLYHNNFLVGNSGGFSNATALCSDNCQDAANSSENPALRHIANGLDNTIFSITHSITSGLAGDPQIAAEVNRTTCTTEHAAKCESVLHTPPNEISIDFYTESCPDLVEFMEKLSRGIQHKDCR